VTLRYLPEFGKVFFIDFILISLWLFKGILVAVYWRIPWSPINPERGPSGGRYRGLWI